MIVRENHTIEGVGEGLCCEVLVAEYFGRSPTVLGAEHVRIFVLHLL